MSRLERIAVFWPLMFPAICAGVLGNWYYHARIYNDPVAVFHRHETELRRYGEQLSTGRVPQVNGNQGEEKYAVPQFFREIGVRSVTKCGDCFVITFGYMAPDAVPQLWFSPGGFDRLPEDLLELQQSSAFFEYQSISPQWSAAWWDL